MLFPTSECKTCFKFFLNPKEEEEKEEEAKREEYEEGPEHRPWRSCKSSPSFCFDSVPLFAGVCWPIHSPLLYRFSWA
jgi:hypothetical protein